MRFFYRPRCLPSVTATGPLLRCNEGVPGSGWRDVKEQYFEVNKRQKIAVARKAGKKEDQAGDLQGRPVVRKCRDVDRNCRPPEGSAAGSGANSAHQGPRRLSGARSPKCAAERAATTNAAMEPAACLLREDGQLGPQQPHREHDVGAPLVVAVCVLPVRS